MASYAVKKLLTARARLGEGVLWDDRRGQLIWVDIYNYCVHLTDPLTQVDQTFEVGDVVGAAVPLGTNHLLLAQRHQIIRFDLTTGQVEPLLTLERDRPENRFNDGKCDPQGRFWFGSMGRQSGQGKLYRYDPDGSLLVMEEGVTIANGLGWSPDQTTFYLTDSPAQRIYAYDYDPQTGQIENRRIQVDLQQNSFVPDGLTIDQEGCIWSAMWDGWCLIRFDPAGQEMERLPMPVQRPTNCTFGGTDLDQLFITSASIGLSEQEIDLGVEAGDLFWVQTQIKGLRAGRFGECL